MEFIGPRSTVLFYLQYVRFFAALSVALFHFRFTFTIYSGPPDVAALASAGYAGVDAFFVLSGFLMVWTSRLTGSSTAFILRRIARLYIGYIPIVLMFMMYKYSTTNIQENIPQSVQIVSSILLLNPDPSSNILFQAWSLYYELIFYISFSLILMAGRRGFVFAAVSAGAGYLLIGWSGVLGAAQSNALLSSMQLEFVLGMALGVIALDGRITAVNAVLAAFLAACLCAVGVQDGGTPWRAAWFGTGFFFLYYALLYLEQRGWVIELPFLKHLGDASYAIYLLHVPIMYVMTMTGCFAWLVGVGGWPLMLASFVAILLTASSLFYLLVERPLNRSVHRQIKRLVEERLGRRRAASASALPLLGTELPAHVAAGRSPRPDRIS